MLIQTFLINPTVFHEIYKNLLIPEVFNPLENLVEAGQQIWKVLVGLGRQQEGISYSLKLNEGITN